MQRREFIKRLSALPLYGQFSSAYAGLKQIQDRRMLILIELKGGNDGVNTLIPYADDNYYQLRPNLAIPRERVIQINERVGLHPALKPIHKLWDANELAIVQGVGYKNPNLSHFRSIDIWNSSSDSDEYKSRGWLANLLQDKKELRNRLADGIVIGRDDGPMKGDDFNAVTLSNPDQFIRQARRIVTSASTSKNKALQHIQDTQQHIISSANLLEQQLSARNIEGSFDKNRIARQLQITARIILSDIYVPVIKISHGSFDTHVNQLSKHERLLQQLASALSVFADVLKAKGKWKNVMIMTYSEFGRRLAENGNRGTDHGTSAPHFIFGGNINAGLYGVYPSLVDVDNGNLKHTVDYRSLYRTAGDWLRVRDNPYSGYKRVL